MTFRSNADNRHARTVTRLTTRVARALALVAALAAAGGCRQGAAGFGGAVAEARRGADDFLGAIAFRFNGVQRIGKFAEARPKLAKHALAPSRLVGDTSIWTDHHPEGTGNAHTLLVTGTVIPRGYLFQARADAPVPVRVGDSRHVMRLRELGDDQYAWDTSVEQSVGEVRPDAIATALTAMFAAAAGIPERELRAEYRSTFPRTTAAMGRLFTMDSLHAVPHPQGGSRVTLSITLNPDRLKPAFPAFSAYLKKYLAPARYRIELRDLAGGRWLDIAADDDRLTIHFRATPAGALLPMEGPPRPMPDHMRIEGEFFAKVMIFEVGAERIVGDFQQLRGAHERGWAFRFGQEPNWQLPLASKHLIRAPLRRPFEREGITLVVTMRDDVPGTEGATLLSRRMHLVVRESAIVRWIGALGGTAAGDFAGASEREENQFIAEAFRAMREDSRAVLGAVPAVAGQ